jgi:dihydrofolate synthase / folylpolyglutamate synthase
MSYSAALDSLHARVGELHAAPGAPRRKFRIEEMQILVEALGHPERRFRSILIAGTNGKGSTAATLAAILQAAGLRTGLYTSPHLTCVNERIRIDGALISDDDFARHYFRVDDCASQLIAEGRLPTHPSFFEALTALAFEALAEARVDIAVLEVGMGGRLDATNVADPLLSVITDISLDHTEWLGGTIALIAREKAGILRRNGVLVTLPQHPEANQAIGEAAVALDVRGINAAEYIPFGPTDPSENTFDRGALVSGHDLSRAVPAPGKSGALAPEGAERVVRSTTAAEAPAFRPGNSDPEINGALAPDPTGTVLKGHDLSHAVPAPGKSGALAPEVRALRNRYPVTVLGETIRVDSPLWGEHQRRNIALAIAAAVELRNHHGYIITPGQIETGIRNTQWPGRLELLTLPAPSTFSRLAPASNPLFPVLLDVAHNPAGVWTLRAALSAFQQFSLPGNFDSGSSKPQPSKSLPPDPCTLHPVLVFGCMHDKAFAEMAQILFPLFSLVVATPVASPRSATAEELAACAAQVGVRAIAASDPCAALEHALAQAPPGALIVVAGSVYLIGEIRELLLRRGATPGPLP